MIELCNTLETLSEKENDGGSVDRRRPSIVDPPVPRMRGPRTTTTSSKVDRRAKAPQTNMTDEYQQVVLNREKRPKSAVIDAQMFCLPWRGTPSADMPEAPCRAELGTGGCVLQAACRNGENRRVCGGALQKSNARHREQYRFTGQEFPKFVNHCF